MELEEACGITEYGTSEPGIGGRIKEKAKDFRVEEIPVEVPSGGKYLICRLQKRGLTTFDAVSLLSSKLNPSSKKVGYAGLKDRKAITQQLVSLEGVDEGEVADLKLDGIKLEPVKRSSRPLEPGDLEGNEFEVTIRDVDLSIKECRNRLEKLTEEIKEGIPNYFGPQRFGGKRPVTHLVGRKLLRRNYRGAVLTYLTETSPLENEKTREARERLSDEENFAEALEFFPDSLSYERKLLEKISEREPDNGEEWAGLLDVFPRGLRRLFVHAYQSFLFNSSLSELLKEGKLAENFPAKLVGYSVRPSGGRFDQETKKLLEEDGIQTEDFKFEDRPELSSEGAIRAALIQTEPRVIEISEDELNSGKRKVKVSFSLKSGRYATAVLREITKE